MTPDIATRGSRSTMRVKSAIVFSLMVESSGASGR